MATAAKAPVISFALNIFVSTEKLHRQAGKTSRSGEPKLTPHICRFVTLILQFCDKARARSHLMPDLKAAKLSVFFNTL